MRYVHIQSVLPQEDVIALKVKSGESSIKDAIAKAIALHFGFENGNHVDTNHLVNGVDSIPAQLPETVVEKQTMTLPLEQITAVNKIGDICPSCGASALVYEEGCAKCHSCGHSEC